MTSWKQRLVGSVSGLVVAAVVAAPAPAAAGDTDWMQISAGSSHTCAVKADGRLFCWGNDSLHQLGNGGTNADQTVPTEVAGGRTDWLQVSAGADHTCGRTEEGPLFCWGSDSSGELGDGGDNTDRKEPVLVDGGITDWTDVSAGVHRTCGVRATGQLLCWGSDRFGGALGNGGPNVDQPTPVPVAGGATNWSDVDATGDYHVCALKTTGRLFCWGYDRYGQLGDGGDNTSRHRPVAITPGTTSWTEVALGQRHTCARTSAGLLFCWGSNALGQLGTGESRFVERQRPTPVVGDATWSAVEAGGDTSCGVRTNGRAYCWGDDRSSQLGDGGARASRSTPTRVASPATNWSTPAVGGGHVCARKVTDRLFCWGSDFSGALGNGGTANDQSQPVEVA